MADSGAEMRPDFMHRFRAAEVRPVISEVLRSELEGKQYEGVEMAEISRRISEAVAARVAGSAGLERYKIISTVSMFENSGQGARMGSSAVWDDEADGVVHETFANDQLRCVAAVYALCVY
ncbi:Tctex1 domain-containing protein 2 [Coemansia guatemalensis]|uniref:Tctex1 domain-containing protein 2 n=1 Tax=Coemansia guatemalensis TaxID=2761395 RepID=A0A9W8LT01_9FUNG|nr:Tctex1 domain-containing protein 2 [Coemansia guatemalensis]